MSKIFASVSINLDSNILLASLPLFEAKKIDAIEWSFDTLFKIKEIPGWFFELLQVFSKQNRLIGHGVYFSLFSGMYSKDQQDWLIKLKELSHQFNFSHITEHFGFVTGENFHTGAPLSVPFSDKTLSIGRDRLKRISNACDKPVGLENLAFAYTSDDVKKHGNFLSRLLEPVNGFIILDLHNIFCQAHNFDINAEALIELYPLELVREIHISGGSWENSLSVPGKQIRRDTHDDSVPVEVFELLELVIPKCSNLKYVVLEQLSHALDSDEKRNCFRNDFLKVSSIIQQQNKTNKRNRINHFLPSDITLNSLPVEDEVLYNQQTALSQILEEASSYEHAMQMLQQSGFNHTCWNIEDWQPYMLETAISIAQKWKNGFE